jgi:hypothetical protein
MLPIRILGVLLVVFILAEVCVAMPNQNNNWGGPYFGPPQHFVNLPAWDNPWWGENWGMFQKDFWWENNFGCCPFPPHHHPSCPPPPATIPAPGALILSSIGLAGVGMLRRKFSKFF